VLKHGHIGDAFFDVDAAKFLLNVLQQQQQQQHRGCRVSAPDTVQEPGAATTAALDLVGKVAGSSVSSASGNRARSCNDEVSGAQSAAAQGHAVGPRWVSQLPKGKLSANVVLETNALVSHSPLRRSGAAAGIKQMWPADVACCINSIPVGWYSVWPDVITHQSCLVSAVVTHQSCLVSAVVKAVAAPWQQSAAGQAAT